MHDLVRLFAQRVGEDNAHADARNQSRDRLFSFYLRNAEAADAHLRALPGMTVPHDFTDRDTALAWLDAERANLVVLVTMAARTSQGEIALRLAKALIVYLGWRRHLEDKLSTTTTGLDVARNLGNRQAEADALINLGNVLDDLGRFEDALQVHQNAQDACRDIGSKQGVARALTNLGASLWAVRRFDESITAQQDAVRIFQEIGDRHGESQAVGNLGLAFQGLRRFEEAIAAHKRDLAICRELATGMARQSP